MQIKSLAAPGVWSCLCFSFAPHRHRLGKVHTHRRGGWRVQGASEGGHGGAGAGEEHAFFTIIYIFFTIYLIYNLFTIYNFFTIYLI